MKTTKTYMIVQYSDDGESQIVSRGLSLTQARMETLTSPCEDIAYMPEVKIDTNTITLTA